MLKQAMISSGREEWKRGVGRNGFFFSCHEGKVEIWSQSRKKHSALTGKARFLGVPNCSRVLLPSKPMNGPSTYLRSCLVLLVISTFAFSLGLHRHLPCLGRRHLPAFPPSDGVGPLPSAIGSGTSMGPLRLLFLYRPPSTEL
ncbi:uncharacterized protein BO97DRAFT_88354 [Aspergillus homomorphus CBS 101889]|uniref:Uncharacterized protein n=1 Tax=Aspergillus homomorphus (strain CBS 101889) TaxID=1450537 RepID=A0A395HWL4_ASPHC|nr:hypothetical protein BO97DRAFT_88354 [Aspergillus homomorphus CBS 101889]RAL11906.1 hypothetical protein BO97DRAFT_88354 [Aspergillus homomorphus CBS 101889]